MHFRNNEGEKTHLLKGTDTNWKSTGQWLLTCFKNILKISHSNYLSFWSNLSVKFAIFEKISLLFNSFYCFFLFINKILRMNNSKTRTAMIIYFLLYNLHDCTFNDSFFVLRNWLYVFYKFHSKWRKNALVEIAFMSLIKCAPFVNIYIYLFFLGLNLVSNILTNDISESRCDAQLRKWLFSSAH